MSARFLVKILTQTKLTTQLWGISVALQRAATLTFLVQLGQQAGFLWLLAEKLLLLESVGAVQLLPAVTRQGLASITYYTTTRQKQTNCC